MRSASGRRPDKVQKTGSGSWGLALGMFATMAGAVWVTGEISGALTHGSWPQVSPADAGRILVLLVSHPLRPPAAWPLAARKAIPGAGIYYAVLTGTLVLGSVVAWSGFATVRRLTQGPRPRLHQNGPGLLSSLCSLTTTGTSPHRHRSGRSIIPTHGTSWARTKDLRTLIVSGPSPGRLTLGRSGGKYLAAEARQSVIVVGPTQTMKTSGFAVPAILEWEGPVLATSVKADLVRDTLSWRSTTGQVWLYDPTASTGLPTAGWSPLASSISWAGARRMAAALCSAARVNGDGMSEADFWYATAAKLLAPLLLAAAASGRTMTDVVRWVDTQEVDEVDAILNALGIHQAIQAAWASWRREDRQRSSVYATAETIIEAFADPSVSASAARSEIDPTALLDGGRHSLYVCAPAHEQRRLRPVFSALVNQVLVAAYERASLRGEPLDPPLLVVLDEAANVAPLSELDAIAATAAGHGIQLVTVWQDMAQVAARYGPRAATVVNNHRAKVVLSGISDPATLEHVSMLVGDQDVPQSSTTTDAEGRHSTTDTTTRQRLAPADALRRISPGEGVLIYGHLPPARLSLRPWFADRELARRAAPRPSGRP
ncbi:MAG: type IV secretory system conjugative DNA transfer family protein [Acidimicrobiales bacterium]